MTLKNLKLPATLKFTKKNFALALKKDPIQSNQFIGYIQIFLSK